VQALTDREGTPAQDNTTRRNWILCLSMWSPCGRAQTTRANTQNGTFSWIQSLNSPNLFASRSVCTWQRNAHEEKSWVWRPDLSGSTVPTNITYIIWGFSVPSTVLKTLCMPSYPRLTHMNMQGHLFWESPVAIPVGLFKAHDLWEYNCCWTNWCEGMSRCEPDSTTLNSSHRPGNTHYLDSGTSPHGGASPLEF